MCTRTPPPPTEEKTTNRGGIKRPTSLSISSIKRATQPPQDLMSSITGIVIDENNLPRPSGQSLTQTRYNFSHVIAVIERRNDNRN
jgi:hypothetical protein